MTLADRERELIDRYGVAELRAMATRALVGSVEGPTLLREQLRGEEAGDGPASQ